MAATGGEFRTLVAPAADFGRDSTTTILEYMRSVYQAVPIRHALRDESEAVGNRNALRSKSPGPRIRAAVRPELPRATQATGPERAKHDESKIP